VSESKLFFPLWLFLSLSRSRRFPIQIVLCYFRQASTTSNTAMMSGKNNPQG